VRRQSSSRLRLKVLTDSSAASPAGGDHRPGGPATTSSAAIRPPDPAATAASRAATSSSAGGGTLGAGWAPGPAAPNSSRCSGAAAVLLLGAQWVTTWHWARVSAT
jgi:hypothetical protein